MKPNSDVAVWAQDPFVAVCRVVPLSTMPFKLTKGDLARQPKLCEIIVALRATYTQVHARVGYLGRKGGLTDGEQAEKTLKEEEMAALQVKIGNLHRQVKSTAAADLAKIATVAATDHMATQAAMSKASQSTELALKQAERSAAAAIRHVNTVKEGIRLNAAAAVHHDKARHTINSMLVATDATVIEEDVAAEVEGGAAAEVDGGAAAEVDGDAAVIEPKPKARTRAKARPKARAAPPEGALVCGRGSCDFWTNRKASWTTHLKNCKEPSADVPLGVVPDVVVEPTMKRRKTTKADNTATELPADAVSTTADASSATAVAVSATAVAVSATAVAVSATAVAVSELPSDSSDSSSTIESDGEPPDVPAAVVSTTVVADGWDLVPSPYTD